MAFPFVQQYAFIYSMVTGESLHPIRASTKNQLCFSKLDGFRDMYFAESEYKSFEELSHKEIPKFFNIIQT